MQTKAIARALHQMEFCVISAKAVIEKQYKSIKKAVQRGSIKGDAAQPRGLALFSIILPQMPVEVQIKSQELSQIFLCGCGNGSTQSRKSMASGKHKTGFITRSYLSLIHN